MEPTAGSFVWYELTTDDRERAEGFYGAVAGWKSRSFDGAIPYSLWSASGRDVGGLMELPEEVKEIGVPPNWQPYVGTSDIQETVSGVRELGGQVLREPAQIAEGAMRFAVVADPQGAIFQLLQGNNETPPFPPAVGGFSWHELVTTDYQAASDFYSALFGWHTLQDMDMGEAGIYRIFGRDGVQWGGMFNKSDEMPVPPSWLLYVRVADLEASMTAVREGGGQVLNGPMEVPGGDYVAQCLDPSGAAFALHQVSG